MSLLEKVGGLGNLNRQMSTAAFCRSYGVNASTSSTNKNERQASKTALHGMHTFLESVFLYELKDAQK
jgi:hypothetical protein